jgi:hypothetical protein
MFDKKKCAIKPKIDQYYDKKEDVYPDIHFIQYLNNHKNNNSVQREISNSFDFFDKNVRTGDEYFVPQYYTNYLINISNFTASQIKPTPSSPRSISKLR